MIALCTAQDVTARPQLAGVPLSAVQSAQLPGYIEEASTLVCGYLGHTYTADETVPEAARVVCARMVARALTTSPVDPNASEYSRASAMGSFSATSTAHVAADVLGGGVWLTKQDKMALDSIGAITRRTVVNLPMYATSWCPDAPDRWWLMTPAPGDGNP